jgi:hypothetical protein
MGPFEEIVFTASSEGPGRKMRKGYGQVIRVELLLFKRIQGGGVTRLGDSAAAG